MDCIATQLGNRHQRQSITIPSLIHQDDANMNERVCVCVCVRKRKHTLDRMGHSVIKRESWQ